MSGITMEATKVKKTKKKKIKKDGATTSKTISPTRKVKSLKIVVPAVPKPTTLSLKDVTPTTKDIKKTSSKLSLTEPQDKPPESTSPIKKKPKEREPSQQRDVTPPLREIKESKEVKELKDIVKDGKELKETIKELASRDLHREPKDEKFSPRGNRSNSNKKLTNVTPKKEEPPSLKPRPSTAQSLTKNNLTSQPTTNITEAVIKEKDIAEGSNAQIPRDEEDSSNSGLSDNEQPVEPPPIPEKYISLFQNSDTLHNVFKMSKGTSQIPDYWFFTPTYIPVSLWDQKLKVPEVKFPNFGTMDDISLSTLVADYNALRQHCPIHILEKKQMNNPVNFIDAFNQTQGEKYKIWLAHDMRRDWDKREQEVDEILDLLKKRRLERKPGNQTGEDPTPSADPHPISFKSTKHGNTIKKAIPNPIETKSVSRSKLVPKQRSSSKMLFHTKVKSDQKKEEEGTVEKQEIGQPTLPSRIPNPVRSAIRTVSEHNTQTDTSLISNTNIDNVEDLRTSKSRSLTSSPIQHESNNREIHSPEDTSIIRTSLASMLADASNMDLPRVLSCINMLIVDTCTNKEEELENISILYLLMKNMQKHSEEEYKNLCHKLCSSEQFVSYLKEAIIERNLGQAEVVQFISKILRKLSDYSFQILGNPLGQIGFHQFAKFSKVNITDSSLVESGITMSILEKMDTLIDVVKSHNSLDITIGQERSSPDNASERTVLGVLKDLFFAISSLAASSKETRETILVKTQYFGIVSAVFKMKRAPRLKITALLSIERMILTGTTRGENEEYIDDGTTSLLIDLGLVSQIISEYNSFMVKTKKVSKKRGSVSLKQALYQVIRALSVHDKAREEMYKTGLFHNLLSMMREIGNTHEETEEDTSMKGLVLETVSNFVPSSSIHRDTLILKYIFETVVEMFVSTPLVSSNTFVEQRTLHILSQLSDYTRTHQAIYDANVVKHAIDILQRDLGLQVFPSPHETFVFSMTSSTFFCMFMVSNLSKYKEGQRHIADIGLTPIIQLLKFLASIAEYKVKLESDNREMNIIFTPTAMSFEEYEILPKVISRTMANISTLPESHFVLFKESFLDSLTSCILHMKGERTVIWNCLCTLSNLCEADAMMQKKLLAKTGVRKGLLKYLVEEDHKLQSRSMRCISKLARNESLLTQIHDSFKVYNIVKAMESNSMDECKLDGLKILFQLSQFEQFQPSFLKTGAIELFVNVIQSSTEALAVESLKNILNLVFSNEPAVKEAIIQAGAVEKLWELKKNEKSSEKVRRLCLSVLKAM